MTATTTFSSDVGRPGVKLHPSDDPVLLTTVALRREDKRRLDRLQAWLSFHEGRHLRQWEVVRAMLDEVDESVRGRLVASDLRGPRLPKAKAP